MDFSCSKQLKGHRNRIPLTWKIIVNPKLLEGGLAVIQLEIEVGAVIKSLESSLGINGSGSFFFFFFVCEDHISSLGYDVKLL